MSIYSVTNFGLCGLALSRWKCILQKKRPHSIVSESPICLVEHETLWNLLWFFPKKLPLYNALLHRIKCFHFFKREAYRSNVFHFYFYYELSPEKRWNVPFLLQMRQPYRIPNTKVLSVIILKRAKRYKIRIIIVI